MAEAKSACTLLGGLLDCRSKGSQLRSQLGASTIETLMEEKQSHWGQTIAYGLRLMSEEMGEVRTNEQFEQWNLWA